MTERSKRILVVDDEPDVLEICARVLSRAGYDVSAAQDAGQARGYLAQAPFDLAIMDIHMPDENGISLLKHAHTVDPALPVVLITGYPAVNIVLDSIRLNVHEFLVKPFTLQQLLKVVNSALAAGEKTDPPGEG